MEKIYVVCWGLASINDDGNSTANCGVVGAYLSRESAEEALKKDIKEFTDELVSDANYSEEEKLEVLESIQCYGSVEDGYFELDYDGWDVRNEYRVEIVEKEIQK